MRPNVVCAVYWVTHIKWLFIKNVVIWWPYFQVQTHFEGTSYYCRVVPIFATDCFLHIIIANVWIRFGSWKEWQRLGHGCLLTQGTYFPQTNQWLAWIKPQYKTVMITKIHFQINKLCKVRIFFFGILSLNIVKDIRSISFKSISTCV